MKWLLVMAVMVAIAGCSAGQDKAAAEAGVAQFHRQMNAREYHDIYDAADPAFRQSGSEGAAIRFLDQVRERLGTVRRTEQRSWRVNFTPEGRTVALEYATEFTEGRGIENFIFRIADGRTTLVGYHINSSDLMPTPFGPPPQVEENSS